MTMIMLSNLKLRKFPRKIRTTFEEIITWIFRLTIQWFIEGEWAKKSRGDTLLGRFLLGIRFYTHGIDGPVSWGCKIHCLLLYRGLKLPKECSGYDTKQSDDEAPVMLELWEMWSTSSLQLLTGSIWREVVALDRVLFMGQIEVNCVLMPKGIVWNRIVFDIETAYIRSTELFEIEQSINKTELCTHAKLNHLK